VRLVERIKGRAPIPESEVTWLGAVDGRQYGTVRCKEYAVDLTVSDPQAYTPQPDEITIVRRRVERFDDGGELVSAATSRGWPVPAGTYAKLAAKRKPTAEKKMRGWDRLAAMPIMQRREPLRMASATAALELPVLDGQLTKDQEQAMASVVELAIKRAPSLIEVGGNTPPDGSVADMVAYLAERGVELSLARGRLRARSKTPIRADVQALLDGARELLVGHLQGKPVMCSECAETAVTIAAVDAPVCREHAQ